jgi:hypothetical protein
MVQWYDEIIAGGVSGMAGVIIGHPFDTVKVLMQTDSKYKSPVQCLRSVVKSDGLRSLYNGILPPLAIATAINAILFFSFEFSLRLITKQKPNSDESPNNVSPSLTQIFLAGSFAGFVQTGVGVPAEVADLFGERFVAQPTNSKQRCLRSSNANNKLEDIPA